MTVYAETAIAALLKADPGFITAYLGNVTGIKGVKISTVLSFTSVLSRAPRQQKMDMCYP